MSNDSPPIEQQRFARTQTPESPRPVHIPEPAKIPVLLNQMDQASNDLATYNIPTDQTFAHYGDSLENPAYKSSPSKEDHDPFRDFLRQADSAVANPPEPNATLPTSVVATNPAVSDAEQFPNGTTGETVQNTNHNGLNWAQLQSAANYHTSTEQTAQTATLSVSVPPPLPTTSQGNNATFDQNQDQSTVQSQAQEAGYDYTQPQTQPDSTLPTLTHTTASAAESKSESGVDYQSLLDNIAQSASTAPAADVVTALTTASEVPESQTSSLPSFPGLPPKPPPLDPQSAFPLSVDTPQAQQLPIAAALEGLASLPSALNGSSVTNSEAFPTANQPSNTTTIPYAGGVTNEQALALQAQFAQQTALSKLTSTSAEEPIEPSDRPWSPKTQAIYDAFLEDERRYVTEGIWDRFPMGSRLFVGNLPSEKVTKRDLFHRFHKHGRLAQISIKQAYGFVQYHLAEDCKRALDAEQGGEIRGRKVHLEVSKPQKGSKASSQSKSQPQTQPRRRSRSPQRRSYSDYRDEPSRRRDDYRRRSPSPPRYRRDDRSGSREDRRSPVYGNNFGPPLNGAFVDDEASLPYPRRDPRYVPDVQIIVLDTTVSQAFIHWIEDGFKRKALNANTTWLNARTPLAAVVKRQIVEGVQAVVKLAASHQARSKIPLQVFDRSAGTSNVTFNEYVDLDIPVAADIVVQARQRERSSMQRSPYPPSYPSQSPYSQSSPTIPWQPPHNAPYPPPPKAYSYPPPQQQQFRPPQPQQYPTPNSAASNPPNLQELLANLKSGSNAPPTPQSSSIPPTPYGQPPPPQYPYGPPPPQQGYIQQPYQQQSPQQQQNSQSNVQYLLDQMSRNR